MRNHAQAFTISYLPASRLWVVWAINGFDHWTLHVSEPEQIESYLLDLLEL
jgi:hypothetical protein